MSYYVYTTSNAPLGGQILPRENFIKNAGAVESLAPFLLPMWRFCPPPRYAEQAQKVVQMVQKLRSEGHLVQVRSKM
jgi:hypothetical protein